jgi:hypothetical protein
MIREDRRAPCRDRCVVAIVDLTSSRPAGPTRPCALTAVACTLGITFRIHVEPLTGLGRCRTWRPTRPGVLFALLVVKVGARGASERLLISLTPR